MKPNQIICGDNVETMSGFPDDCIDLIVTSPPYDQLRTYGGHSWDFEGVANQLWRVIKPGGVVVWVVADQTVDGSESGESFRQALRFKEIGFRLHDTMIWEKTGNGSIGSQLCYSQQTEYMFVFAKGQPTTTNLICDKQNVITSGRVGVNCSIKPDGTFDRRVVQRREFGVRTNVWRKETQRNSSHSAPFPESLASDHILSWSNEGDLVLDPFAGSFTTCRAAMDNGRDWIGIEINQEYCEIGQKRLKQKVLF